MAAITLKQLRAFAAVAKTERFRLAAEEIGLTQSAVSVLIKELEGQIGTSLFDRHTRMVGLTDAGERFLPLALEILERVDGATDLMSDLSSLQTGHVTIASAVVLAATYLPKKITSFQKLHPEIKINLLDVSEGAIRQLLLNRQADIGVGSSRFMEAEINERVIFTDHLAVFCHSDHPLVQRKELRWRDLRDYDFIGLSDDNPLQRKVDEIFEKRKIQVKKRFSVQFSTTLLALVEQDLGLGVLPENSKALSGNSNIKMLRIGTAAEARQAVAFNLRERALSPAAASFFAHLFAKNQ